VHIYVLDPKLLQWNFLQISQLSIRSGAHKIFSRFVDFPSTIFDRNFVNIMAPPDYVNGHSIEHLKGQSFLYKKTVKTTSQSIAFLVARHFCTCSYKSTEILFWQIKYA